jgi:hypothetical protein
MNGSRKTIWVLRFEAVYCVPSAQIGSIIKSLTKETRDYVSEMVTEMEKAK